MSGILVKMRVIGAGFIFALMNVRALALEKGTCLIPDTSKTGYRSSGAVDLLALAGVS